MLHAPRADGVIGRVRRGEEGEDEGGEGGGIGVGEGGEEVEQVGLKQREDGWFEHDGREV